MTACSSAVKIASRYFEDLLEEQGFLDTEEQWSKMLALVPEKTRQLLHEEWHGRPQDTGSVRWRRLANEVTVSDRPAASVKEPFARWCTQRFSLTR